MNSWKVISLAGFITTGILIWSGPAQAQFFGGNIDRREAAQEQRIREGIRAGAITPHEAGRLATEQQRIQRAEARMRADGRLNYQERARLDRMQDNAGRHIYQQSHDNQVYARYPNHPASRYQHWQQRRYHQGNHYSYGRPNRCERRGVFRPPHHGAPGRSSWPPQRHRRLAWN